MSIVTATWSGQDIGAAVGVKRAGEEKLFGASRNVSISKRKCGDEISG